MVIARDHMLRAQIHERQELDPAYFLHIALVALGNAMGKGICRPEHEEQKKGCAKPSPGRLKMSANWNFHDTDSYANLKQGLCPISINIRHRQNILQLSPKKA